MTSAAAKAPGSAIPPEAGADAAVLTENLGKTYPGGTVAVGHPIRRRAPVGGASRGRRRPGDSRGSQAATA